MASTVAIVQKSKYEVLTRSVELTVAAGVTIYEGTLVSIDASGDAIVGVTSARIAGIAQNSAVAGESVTCYNSGSWWLVKSDASATDVDKAAYAADNNTVTLTPNTAILGMIDEWKTGYVLVNLSRVV
jgi:predicted RecA/RadA family phage recombinase